MKSNKLSTVFLLLLMVFTLTISIGCGKENTKPKDNDNDNKPTDVVDKNDDNNNKQDEEEKPSKPQKTVKLLKRNGVEWKENTKIDSYRGAQKYTVVWGDTLSLIARTWNVNCYTLARYNGIKNIDRIEVGQVIYNYTYKD